MSAICRVCRKYRYLLERCFRITSCTGFYWGYLNARKMQPRAGAAIIQATCFATGCWCMTSLLPFAFMVHCAQAYLGEFRHSICKPLRRRRSIRFTSTSRPDIFLGSHFMTLKSFRCIQPFVKLSLFASSGFERLRNGTSTFGMLETGGNFLRLCYAVIFMLFTYL